MNPTSTYRPGVSELEARVAQRIVARLSEHSGLLGHDITERLRVGREQALARARQARQAKAVVRPALQVFGASRSTLALGRTPSRWLRLAALLPLLVLIAGLLAIQHLHEQAEIEAAAEVDAALLSDDLPPEAYGDPGFVVFLKQPQP